MKNVIKEILISQMSFPLKYKNEKEVWRENEYGHTITVEIINIENEQYVERRYYDNGQLYYKDSYYQGKWHGECLEWYYNGQLWIKSNHYQGQPHGECLWGIVMEKLGYEKEYNYGKLINEEYYY